MQDYNKLGGQGWIWTNEVQAQMIYSHRPLPDLDTYPNKYRIDVQENLEHILEDW